MASINKLSIRGVRSFSPDADEQVLEFFFPCTIIVGANGCGKTTIIESLKFAVCGAMPPGNKSGQAFVHDPRSIGHSSVKANIKLRFTNRAGSSMVVVRSMEVTKKRTTMTFKQLDGALRTVDKDGNRQALSHKCSELDKQIPILLGVSKAILEHVVFCHQEDASWPLQEGAVLKKRFDDIFDSTRYSKALEVYAKLKKEYVLKVKDLKADLAGLASHRHAAKGFRQEVERFSAQLEDLEEEISTSKKELKENETEQERIKEIIEQVDELRNEIESQKNELIMEQQIVKNRRNMLQEDLTDKHTIRELKEMLSDFEAEIGNQVEKQKELHDEVRELNRELSRLRKQKEDMQSNLGRLQAAKEAHESSLKERFEKMMSIGQRFGLGDVLTPLSMSQTQMTQTQNTSYHASSMEDESSSTGEQSRPPQQQQQPQPVLDISQEDMDEFFRALTKKEDELKENLGQLKKTHQEQEDHVQAQLAEIIGRLNSIRNERQKLEKQQADARKELQQISTQLSSTSRLRKSDVEEAKRNAARLAVERDKAHNNPRRTEIPVEIRSFEEKIDRLKREIEDDQILLKMLQHSADAQNAIVVLREQSTKELESLQESIKEHAYAFQQYNIPDPEKLPETQADVSGGELTQLVTKIVDDFSDKYQSLNLQLTKANEKVSNLQKDLSEKQALLAHNQRTLSSKRGAMAQLDSKNGSIEKVRRAVEQLRQFEEENGVLTLGTLDETKPRELLAYVNDKLQDEESMSTEGIQPAIVRKVMRKLKQQVKINFECPCCAREFSAEEEVAEFQRRIEFLSTDDSPILKIDERNKIAKANYQKWRKVISDNINDVLDYRRLANEVNDLEGLVKELRPSLSEKQQEMNDALSEKSDIQESAEQLRSYMDASRRWSDTASRIAEKRMQINQKQSDLSMSSTDVSGRDLRTVENDVNEKIEKKDNYVNQINKLNKEMGTLQNIIHNVSVQASRSEKLAREKEEKFGSEQTLSDKKGILNETMAKCVEEDKKLQDGIAPLRQKQREKDAEKKRMRAQANEEEERANNTLNDFTTSVQDLKSVVRRIDEYKASKNEDNFLVFSNKAEELTEMAKDVQVRIKNVQPDLDRIEKAVKDREQHKKNLQENMELITSSQKIGEIEKKIARLEEAASKIEGQDTCFDDMERLTSRKQEMLSSVARLEGRRGEIAENIRTQKRKLSAPEYKDVEEEHRIAVIKHETTQMAVRDLEKYHNALDRALLKFHSLKISEINKIIRELWTLTYKGEDITNIEIVSGQEAGSRASRSYNYRVVMTKGGNTQLDMRGRCSAGQRVLASIVIRLALAETFCLNCGCIALDEPTVNLDFNNKRGLAIALAQITASRAQQRNFQLILITHDEDFVAMMKTELSTQTGFTMPEKYFQVRREQGTDGKFYSKIDAIDWDELL